MNENETGLKEHHQFRDFLYWNAVAAVPVVTASLAIIRSSIIWFVIYLFVCIACLLILYKFYCSHCPHYIYGGHSMRCMFFWGVPKIFAPRPVPLSIFEKALSIAAPSVAILFPLYWLIREPGLLLIFILSVFVLVVTARRYECCRCVYFGCPSNCVPEEMRKRSLQD
ncbi:MAG: hypothetical protein U9R24_04745 [Thermodesulfobacteriota bacterium]|nr:hypothetical protein [Thermodesulfobacteriota bacterium]